MKRSRMCIPFFDSLFSGPWLLYRHSLHTMIPFLFLVESCSPFPKSPGPATKDLTKWENSFLFPFIFSCRYVGRVLCSGHQAILGARMIFCVWHSSWVECWHSNCAAALLPTLTLSAALSLLVCTVFPISYYRRGNPLPIISKTLFPEFLWNYIVVNTKECTP